ncbi:anti-anti-sigma factor [Sorangium cellulosum]|uniref:Anti-anti-sigma factor n=1 Tax=Sorangium cellulosum TaxID=56 RepID=A0A4P2QAY1_SORCE|nr:PAS domain-containing protein [Sorangium cellulosum]AUX26471.1 anti-anti-sigma factor [Sorangium cellulosum]
MKAVRGAPFAVIECAGNLDDLVVAGWNAGAEHIFGYTSAEAVGRPLTDTILSGPDGEAWRRALGQEGAAPLRCTHTSKDGRTVVCEWHHAPVLDDAGGPTRLLCFGHDVTELVTAVEALRQRDVVLRAILGTLETAVTRMDRDGYTVFHEGKLLDALGMKQGQFIGMNVFDPPPAPMDMEPLRRGVRGESMRARVEVFGTIWETWVIPLRDARGEPDGAVSVVLDATEAKVREDELRSRIELIERQQEVIRSLSAPIIEVWDGVLTLPMVGVVDSQRAAEVMDSLLAAIVDKQARFAILDLTGVELVDTKTASYLIELVRAIRLLGAEGVITGIRPNVAQTMVALGLDLSGIATRGNLRAGLRLCIQRLSAGGAANGAPAGGAPAPAGGGRR